MDEKFDELNTISLLESEGFDSETIEAMMDVIYNRDIIRYSSAKEMCEDILKEDN